MDKWISSAHWDRLRDEISGEPFASEPIYSDGILTPCAIAIDDKARLHLLVQVPSDDVALPPDLNGVTIRYADYGVLVVDVAVDASLEVIINQVFQSIVEGCIDGRNPVAVVTDYLDRLRKAFSRAGAEISEIKQIGLIGELLTMHHILIPAIGSRAALLWSGPLGERHDFVGDRVHLEVKSTTRSLDQHEISRLDQLRPPEGKQLLLVSIQLERSLAGELSIATMRDSIIKALGSDGIALDAFETRIKLLGWHDGLVQSGTLLKFNLRALTVFCIDGSFPRLPDDYEPPRGVVAVSYTINVSACPAMEPPEVMRVVAGM